MKQYLMPVFILVTVFVLFGCQSVWTSTVPDYEILYQGEITVNGSILNFVSPDGSNNQVTEIDRFTKPVWSSDGKFIYGLSRGLHSYVGYPAYWDLEEGRFKVCSRNLPSFDQIRGWENPQHPDEVIVEDIWTIIVFDISQCKEMHSLVDYSTQPGNYAIHGFSYSSSRQELIYGLVVHPYEDQPEYRLMHLDLKTGEMVQLAEGINPAWSPDDRQIAYVGLDGLYVLELNGNEPEPRQLIDQPFFDPWASGSPWSHVTVPSWSPDGTRLVYHRCSTPEICNWKDAQIYIFNLATGQEESILQGGEYPSWQP